MRTIFENKKILFNYKILDKFKAGIALNGQEVKSIKSGRANFSNSFVVIKKTEAFLIGANIPAWQPKNIMENYNQERPRKLLFKKSEIKKLFGKLKEKGLTMVPLKVYTNPRELIKIEVAIVKPKRKIDKREKIKKREIEREIKRRLKS